MVKLCVPDEMEVYSREVLLVGYPLVHSYQRVELALGGLDELSVPLAAPASLPDGNDLVLLAEETFEPAVEVLVKQ